MKDISDLTIFPGIRIYVTKAIKRNTAICLPGLGILIHSSISEPNKLMILQHEYGHYLDFVSVSKYKIVRYLYYYMIVAPTSIISATVRPRHHYLNWVEQRASNKAAKFFGENLDPQFRKYFQLN